MITTCRAVPQAAEFLDPPTLSKGKTEKTKNKKREAAKEKAPTLDMTGFTSAPAVRPLSTSGSPEPGQARNSPAPNMMKQSFARVSEPASGSGTPVGGSMERTKVAFGFGMKRKAGDEGSGTPPKKR